MQLGITLDFAVQETIKSLESHFGKGYAAKNPALVGQLVDAGLREFSWGCSNAVAEQQTARLCGALEQLADALAKEE